MYALFEDAGRFHAGRVMTDAESSMQVELDSGKRVKVKSANVLLRFEQPAPAELMARAQQLALDTSMRRPAPPSRPPRCSACSRRRTISGASAAASSARPRRRS
jgi:hypothetical protein